MTQFQKLIKQLEDENKLYAGTHDFFIYYLSTNMTINTNIKTQTILEDVTANLTRYYKQGKMLGHYYYLQYIKQYHPDKVDGNELIAIRINQIRNYFKNNNKVHL